MDIPREEGPSVGAPGPEDQLARLLPGLGRVDLAKLSVPYWRLLGLL